MGLQRSLPFSADTSSGGGDRFNLGDPLWPPLPQSVQAVLTGRGDDLLVVLGRAAEPTSVAAPPSPLLEQPIGVAGEPGSIAIPASGLLPLASSPERQHPDSWPGGLLAHDPLSQAVAALPSGSALLTPAADPGSPDASHVQGGRCSCLACSAGDSLAPGGRSSATTVSGGGTSAAPAAAASLQTLADYLTTGYWQEAGTYNRRFNLTSSGTGAKNGVITYNLSGWADDADGLVAERQALVREVFKVYAAVLGIGFREVAGAGGDIRFTDNDTGAYAYMASGWYADSSQSRVIIDYSVVNVASSWYDGRASYATYTPQTFFHEIGHALGLGHQGLYNGSGSYSTDAKYANDSWQESMMSYFSQTANPTTGASYAFLQTAMAVDWLALGDLYRSQGYSAANAFQGNTVYGVGTNITSGVSQIWNLFSTYAGSSAYTLVDGSGYDLLDVSNFSANQLINLAVTQAASTAPSVSSIGGKIGNLTIAAGTVIEAATGGSGADSFYGNEVANTFRGNAGADSFYDSLGSDIYFGDAGADWLYFTDSIDLFSYSLSGDSLVFSRRSGSADVDRVWNGLENLSFNNVVYSYDQLVASLPASPPAQPTAGVVVVGGASGVNEGASITLDISTLNLAQGASVHWQLSGTGINSSDFVGLSSLTGSTVVDAAGKATLTFSVRADATTEGTEQMGFALFADAALTARLADLSVAIQDTSTTPVVSNLNLWGTTGSDQISGAAGTDRLTGVLQSGSTAVALGSGQIDVLSGGLNADVFLLGDSRGVFYDDRRSGNLGTTDYARITDFRSGEDSLQLRNARYLTTSANGNLSLYWDRNANGRLDTSGSSRDELIAVLQGVSAIASSDLLWV